MIAFLFRLVLDCSMAGNLSGALFVVNTSNPECPSTVDKIINDEVVPQGCKWKNFQT